VERLERLERLDPYDERSEAVERLEPLELTHPPHGASDRELPDHHYSAICEAQVTEEL
jgi:hypothetical protein